MKRDMRTLSHDVLEDIRIRSVRMVIKSQLQNSEVCEIMEIQGPVLSKWIGMYKRG